MESAPPILFDRARNRKRRARAATDFAQHDFLWREAATRTEETLSFIKRDFQTVIGFGTHALQLAPGTRLIQCDAAPAMLHPLAGPRVVADEEWLPFADNSIDAFISLLSLHWVNDLPGALTQIRRVLKPDGLFFAILPGGETLRELRSVFAATEAEQSGGISPRIAPFIDVRDAGALLQRAGFALPVADSELLTISYPNLFALMHDLRGAAQNNMLRTQLQHFTPRRFFMDATERYQTSFKNAEHEITATVEFITLTGWKPAENQQKPAKRGSGTVSLRDVLN